MEFFLLSSPPRLLLLAAAVMEAAALLLSFAVRLRDPKSRRRRRRYHPVVGTVLHQLLHFSRLYHYHTELSRRHKSFRILSTPFHSDVYTDDTAVVEPILRSNGQGKYNYEALRDLLEDGIVTVDGSKWRHQRKLASYEFSTRSRREHGGAVFKNNAAKLAQAVSEAVSSHQA